MSALTLSAERPRVHAIIQCAMPMEAAPFLEALEPVEGHDSVVETVIGVDERHVQRFTLGRLAQRDVLVVTSGIGIANAASATARALAFVDAQVVIAGGTAGGLQGDIEVGDIAACVSTIYNDADATVFGYVLGQIPGMPVDYHSSERVSAALEHLNDAVSHRVRVGRIVTGDSFASEQVVGRIRAGFPDALAVDMETCGLAQVAWSSGVDWVCVRAISDLTGEGSGEAFHMNGETAAYHSFEAVRAFLTILFA